MIENGSGTVTVTVTADPAIVEQAPGLADDLRFDDVLQAGWTIDGPADTETGGLSVVLAHRFDTPQQATALLATLNGADGPFKAITIDRSATKNAITYTVTGSAGIDDLGAFADEALVGLVGGQPYADEIGSRPPADSVRISLIIDVPGSVAETTSTSRKLPLEWQRSSGADTRAFGLRRFVA